MRGQLSNKWFEAQIMHTMTHGSPKNQEHTIVRMMWEVIDEMWKAQNLMEHRTTTEERSLRKIAKMNERLKKVNQENINYLK